MSQGDGLKLWSLVEKTDLSMTKNTRVGNIDITAICAQYQKKTATKQFGPFGIGWGIEENERSWEYREFENKTVICKYSASMWYIFNGTKGSFPISATIKVSYVTKNGKGYLFVDDEYSKKVMTNAVTKGLSALGFNSDVFEGKFEDSQYINTLKAEQEEAKKPELIFESNEYFTWCFHFSKAKDKEIPKQELLKSFKVSDELLEKLITTKPYLVKGTKSYETSIERLKSGTVTIEKIKDHYCLTSEAEKELLSCTQNS